MYSIDEPSPTCKYTEQGEAPSAEFEQIHTAIHVPVRIVCARACSVAHCQSMPLNAHTFDEDNVHHEDECRLCILKNYAADCECRCGHCCERLLLESTVEDAENEPRIVAECKPLRDIGPEVTGYFLNDRDNDMACHFYDRERRLCTIYETRPLMCRVFNCDDERRSGDLVDVLTAESGASISLSAGE